MNPLNEIICLDDRYSTTRRVRKVAPEVVLAEIKAEQKPEDQFETALFLPEGEDRQGEGGLRTKGYFKKSETDKPLITVVTVVFNGEAYLEETILSVINQTYDNVECIVIDGASTDGTVDIIRKYEHAIDYWVSESDKGIYSAMNKGISLACGDYIGLINADDYYLINSVELVVDFFSKDEPDLLYGNKLALHEAMQLVKEVSVPIPRIAKGMLVNNVHPSVFVKTKVYKTRLFNSDLKIAADYDFLLGLFNDGFRFAKIDKTLSVMRTGGGK